MRFIAQLSEIRNLSKKINDGIWYSFSGYHSVIKLDPLLDPGITSETLPHKTIEVLNKILLNLKGWVHFSRSS